ncbi:MULTISPECIES: flagella assembly protein FlgT middle domain-containing protein [Silvimonas]|uniref:flagella assembly protein FlgT middle domain-containing protein n=1 Tax=Silvimonas TaxID=300264 RepID=UPI0024B368D7|nr:MULTISPECIES: flagella assembly protein FlgT middle domain-containing protein [Silvimonas]MDR3426004.1 flagella assembly protein FlgT middle domain-containing protein [Silvimonas sp.]
MPSRFTLLGHSIAAVVVAMVPHLTLADTTQPAGWVNPGIPKNSASVAATSADGTVVPVVTGDEIAPPRCAANPYKRKLLVTPFWVRQPSQSQDLRQLQSGLQQIFQQKFTRVGGWLTSASKGEVPFDLDPRFDAPIFLPDQVRLLGREFGTQLVLGGIVQDISTEGETYRATHGSDVRPGERKLALDGPILDFFGAGLKATPSARHADIEIFVFDTVSGAVVAQRRVQTVVSGDILARASQPVGSAGFMSSDFGKALGSVAEQLVAGAQSDVACVPFSARVTKVENGLAYVDAGAMSGLVAGDHLQFYREKYGMQPISTPGSNPGMGLGLPETRAGMATVAQVQTQFAAVTVDKGQAQPGDFVRFAPKLLNEQNQPAPQPEMDSEPAAVQSQSGAKVTKFEP